MATIIEMPKLSDTMTVGTLVKWLKQEGDSVDAGDMIAEVETDKATMEVENFEEGVILKIYVQEGDQVAIGAPMCAVGDKGEDAPEVDMDEANKVEEAKEEEKDDEPDAADLARSPGDGQDDPTKKEEKPAGEEQPAADKSAGRGSQAPAAPSGDDGQRIKASPLARKIAAEKGVDISRVKGTGPNGRIIKTDVLQAAETGQAAARPDGESMGGDAPAPQLVNYGGPIQEGKSVKTSNMRKTIASRLLESKTTIPHFYLSAEVDAGPLMAMRQQVNAGLEAEGVKLTVNDFILKAAAEALRRVPAINASYQGDTIEYHESVHLAFGVPIPDGLLTPTIKDAHLKTLRAIGAEARALIKKTQAKKLTPDEMTGHTFTVSNLGMPRYGISNFFGIINPPDAAILCVGAANEQPVVKDGTVVPGLAMNLALCCDHRVVDGADGAGYLATLRGLIENPALILV
ncbi:MAG: dihydrolipoamide acetyltransferase family protein [Opitutales bacterium]